AFKAPCPVLSFMLYKCSSLFVILYNEFKGVLNESDNHWWISRKRKDYNIAQPWEAYGGKRQQGCYYSERDRRSGGRWRDFVRFRTYCKGTYKRMHLLYTQDQHGVHIADPGRGV